LSEEIIDLAKLSLGAVAGARKSAARMSAASRGHVAALAHALDVLADFLSARGLGGEGRNPKKRKQQSQKCEGIERSKRDSSLRSE
jgi:hypothetical protein